MKNNFLASNCNVCNTMTSLSKTFIQSYRMWCFQLKKHKRLTFLWTSFLLLKKSMNPWTVIAFTNVIIVVFFGVGCWAHCSSHVYWPASRLCLVMWISSSSSITWKGCPAPVMLCSVQIARQTLQVNSVNIERRPLRKYTNGFPLADISQTKSTNGDRDEAFCLTLCDVLC